MDSGMSSTTEPSEMGEGSSSRPFSMASTAVGEHGNTDDPLFHQNHRDEQIVNNRRRKYNVPRIIPPFLRLRIRDHIKTFLLLALSLVTFPFSFTVAYLLSILPASWLIYLFPFSAHTPASAAAFRQNCRAQPGFREKTVLLTGINMSKGLTLARAFYLAGHQVVGADFDVMRSSVWLPKWLRLGERKFSRALFGAYTLEKPVYSDDMSAEDRARNTEKYVDDMVKIMDDEQVDLWVSCSGVATAFEDGLVSSYMSRQHGGKRKKVVQFEEETIKKFHEKSSFIRYMSELGLSVPETHEVTSHAELKQILADSARANNDRKFILKPVGMDDVHRGNMTLLPLPLQHDTEELPGRATEQFVGRLPISKERPWILQQFIAGNEEYCTHALVVQGEVKVFVACASSEMLMHYKALPTTNDLSMRMLRFTRAVAKAETEKGSQNSFTGHLSFDFMVGPDSPTGQAPLYAIECNPRVHTAVALYATPGDEMRAMVDAYMSVFKEKGIETAPRGHKNGHLEKQQPTLPIGPPASVIPRYWFGHDLVTLVLLPLLRLLTLRGSRDNFVGSVKEFRDHVLYWQEGVFELWDPWPFVALYHNYWPAAIAQAWWRGERWSRVNVSTTKMFAC